MLSFGSKNTPRTYIVACANFLGTAYLGLISDPQIVSKFHNGIHNSKGQEYKIYTIVKGMETFYRQHTVPVTSCKECK